MKARTKIKFKLDGRWDGEGIFNGKEQKRDNGTLYDTLYEVILTKDCKEMEKGTKIFVFQSEIIEIEDSEVEKAFNHTCLNSPSIQKSGSLSKDSIVGRTMESQE
jgi:hypothetical protein